jgi:predicted alpha/beta-hydrolase family hydrolase
MEVANFSITTSSGDTISAETYVTNNASAMLVLAHGAGAGMNHAFMKSICQELANLNIATLRYNFLYMEQNKKRPDFPAVAHQAVAAAIQKAHELNPKLPLFVGGKSFGGRMTSQYLSKHPSDFVKGIVFVGFPLHPAGKPSIERADHLKNIKNPMLFLQGTRDSLAEWNLISTVTESLPTATLKKLDGADHSFKAGKQNLIPALAKDMASWMQSFV